MSGCWVKRRRDALGFFDGAHVGVACVVDENVYTAECRKGFLGIAVHLLLGEGEVILQNLNSGNFEAVWDLGR